MEDFVAAVEVHVEGVSQTPPLRMLSSLIWQVAVYHITDHITFLELAQTHGFCRVKGILKEPMCLGDVGAYDRYQTRNFLNAFVNFTPNPDLDLDQGLLNVDADGFEEGSVAHEAALRFREELVALDARHAAAGTQLLAVDRMIQSICF